MRNIVVDASVVAKWFLPDEQVSVAALKIRQDFLELHISISVPIFIFYEINNLLKSAVVSLRINKSQAKEAYAGFLNLGLNAYYSKDLLEAGLENAISLDVSSYDATYLSLAEQLKIPLFTADQKFIKKASNQLVKNLEEYLKWRKV